MRNWTKIDVRPARRGLSAGRGGARRFRSREGLAALEFALIAPILISMIAGLYDVTTAFIAWRRVTAAALAIGEIATGEASSTAVGINVLNQTQALAAASAVYPYLPNLLGGSPPGFGVTLSSIVMTPTPSGCTTACSYTAHVAWSGVFEGTGTVRPCDTVQGTSVISSVSDTAPPSPATLPQDMFSPAPLLVVDVTYTFQPLFFTFITGNIAMAQTSYLSPRAGLITAWVQYYPGGQGDTTGLCAGYPASTVS
jgi:Flp pilus assembly protein TadG